jgi:hypothetical protein
MDRTEKDAPNNSSVFICVRCFGNVLTEPLPSNNKGDTYADTETDGEHSWNIPLTWLRCHDIWTMFHEDWFRHSKSDRGGGYVYSTQHDDFINLLSCFQNKGSRLTKASNSIVVQFCNLSRYRRLTCNFIAVVLRITTSMTVFVTVSGNFVLLWGQLRNFSCCQVGQHLGLRRPCLHWASESSRCSYRVICTSYWLIIVS